MREVVRRAITGAAILLGGAAAWAGSIDTAFLEAPWPKQHVRDTEVGRYPVRWRERASKSEGIFASVQFDAPLGQHPVWELANQYQDVGQMTPGVTAVRYLEQSNTYEKIEVDVKILWKTLTLTFEVEKDPPRAVRFRLVDEALGDYRGVCLFQPVSPEAADGGREATRVELATWLQPARPVPMRLLLYVERVTLLQGARRFLKACEPHRK